MNLPRLAPGVLRHGDHTPLLSTGHDGVTPQDGMPVYGNYCGLRHGDPTYQTIPRDPVDAACMRHDQCYDRNGYLDCNCDRTLVDELKDAESSPGSDETARIAGAAARAYFSIAPCACQTHLCLDVPYCTLDGCGLHEVCHAVTTMGFGGRAPGCK